MSDVEIEKEKKQKDCYICGKLCSLKGLKNHIRSHLDVTLFDCDECELRFPLKKLLNRHKIIHTTHYLCEKCYATHKDSECSKIHKPFPLLELRKCQHCGYYSVKKDRVSLSSNKNLKKYACIQCNELFSSKSKLSKHEVLCKGTYKCFDCNECFSSPNRLKTHTCLFGKKMNHFCDICDKGFSKKSDLKRHLVTHTGIKPYKCKVCGKGFSTSVRGTHMILHSGLKPYKCSECGKEFSLKGNRDAHLRTHAGFKRPGKKSVCEICFKTVVSSYLKQHILMHNSDNTDEKPYSCDICHKNFPHQQSLKRHTLTHSKDKPFKCDKCDKRFLEKYKLDRHKRRHEPPSITCPTCCKGFYNPSEYDCHLKSHTKSKPYICDVCHEGFGMRVTLQNHYKRIHGKEKNHFCKVCNKGFFRKFDVERHLIIHSDQKSYKCSICNRGFNMKRSRDSHLRTHEEKDKKYSCKMCLQLFVYKKDFKKHLKECRECKIIRKVNNEKCVSDIQQEYNVEVSDYSLNVDKENVLEESNCKTNLVYRNEEICSNLCIDTKSAN